MLTTMARIVAQILTVSIAVVVVGAQPIAEENFDEATIVLPKDLDITSKQQLFKAISGVTSEDTTGEGDTYLLVPGDATVIIVTPEDLTSNVSPTTTQNSSMSERFLPSPLQKYSEADSSIPSTEPIDDNGPSMTLLLSLENNTTTSVNQSSMTQQNNSVPSVGQCTDIPPGKDFTCIQQAAFGKCNAQFILSGNFCAATCGRCTITTEKSGGAMEMSQGDCVPLSVLLLTRNDTQSFRDAINTAELDELFIDPDYSATVFIPNDQAFYQALEQLGQAAPQLTRLSLLKQLMEGHIIPNMAISTEDFVDQQPIIPLSGNAFWNIQIAQKYIQIYGGSLGPANIVEPNIKSCNVVAHIIDKVLVS
eukprot:TRINITY_DN28382_c0_g1_i2.p1 TRINITY_DN28382_c0_g1~~TRINITY_DN28382_c0_g1_i2.p1  ORF type:complete len:364 (-),score=36.45 TRINITY_DN28382_c0_g1_i2:333-1424(-)